MHPQTKEASNAQVLVVATLAGVEYRLSPVPMGKMPSVSGGADWLRFQGAHVPGTSLSKQDQTKVQSFMLKHRTEALTDGKMAYTLAGGMLAACHPEEFPA